MKTHKILLLIITLGVSSCIFKLDPGAPDFQYYYCQDGEEASSYLYRSRIINPLVEQKAIIFLSIGDFVSSLEIQIREPFYLDAYYANDEKFFIEGDKYFFDKKGKCNFDDNTSIEEQCWFSLELSPDPDIAFTVYFNYPTYNMYQDKHHTLSGRIEVSSNYMNRRSPRYRDIIIRKQ